MPKISLHVEADSTAEFAAFVEMLLAIEKARPNVFVDVKEPESAPAPVEDDFNSQVMNKDAEPVAEKPARKPRGPNKPKITPVTEEAPEEVEHVGTVAVAPSSEVPNTDGNGEVLTRMDLGDTIAGYVRKYGINFAQTDVSKMLQNMFGADVRKKSDVPDDQPSLRKAISAITQATVDNPYNRKVDVNG